MSTSFVPDHLDPLDEIPRTVPGMLQEMNDLMKEQLKETDHLTKMLELWNDLQERVHPNRRDPEFVQSHLLVRLILKLQSQVALQGMCVEKMWNELRPPG